MTGGRCKPSTIYRKEGSIMKFQYVSLISPYELHEADIPQAEVDRLKAEYEKDKDFFQIHWHCKDYIEYIEVLLSYNN